MTKQIQLFFFLVLVIIGLALPSFTPASFKSEQLKYERVKTAYVEKEAAVKKLFANKKLNLSQSEILLRVFKDEKQLELWARPRHTNDTFRLVKTYPICSASGEAGPKRKMGDYQVPEGFYTLDRWNPQSNFYLSLGVNYPNASDKILSDKKNPGGDIFIHGNCVSIGCMAMTDPAIKEIYLTAVEARSAGQTQIPVHIFPARLSGLGWTQLQAGYMQDAPKMAFWQNLKTGYDLFEKTKKLPRIQVDAKGKYAFQ